MTCPELEFCQFKVELVGRTLRSVSVEGDNEALRTTLRALFQDTALQDIFTRAAEGAKCGLVAQPKPEQFLALHLEDILSAELPMSAVRPRCDEFL